MQALSAVTLAGLGYVGGSVAYQASDGVLPGDQTAKSVGLAMTVGGAGLWGAGRGMERVLSGRAASGSRLASAIGAIGAAAGVATLVMSRAQSSDSSGSGPAGVSWNTLGGGALAVGAAALVASSGGVRKMPSVAEASTHTLSALDDIKNIDKSAIKAAHKSATAVELAAYGEAYGDDAVKALGTSGKRHIAARASIEDIRTIHPTGEIRTPQRIFVGSQEGASAEDRVALAMKRLRDGGGLTSRDILVVTPNAMGDTIPQVAFSQELMSAGDTTTIAVQSINKSPWRGIPDIKSMGAEQRLLIQAIHTEMSAAGRPRESYRLLVDGHCYGALAGGHALASDGLASIKGIDVDGALLTAGPRGWMPHARLMDEAQPQDGTYLAQTVAQLDDIHRSSTTPKIVFGQHPDDPMRLRLRDFWQPKMTPEGPAPNVPVVRAVNELMDLGAYAVRPTGVLFDVAHDFRAMSARGVRAAFGHTAISDEQVARVERMMARDEAQKAAAGSISRI